MEYRLPQGRNLLEKLDLEGGGTRTATRPEPVEGVVVGDGGGESAIFNLIVNYNIIYSCVITF